MIYNELPDEEDSDNFYDQPYYNPPSQLKLDIVPEEGEFLPFGTVYTKKHKDDTFYLIEVKPTTVIFRCGHDYRDDEEIFAGEYEVAVPWQYFWIHIGKAAPNHYYISSILRNVQLFWAQQRLVNLDSEVYPARLPNICRGPKDFYSELGIGHVCLGGAAYELPNHGTNAEMAEAVVDGFYDGTFNNNMNTDWPIPFQDANKWAQETEKNPYGWIDWLKDEPTEPISKFLLEEIQGYN